jgi:outer membrane receptor protein involved in Fe transport
VLNDTRVYLGIENVFDEDLPFVAASTDGWDRYLADYRGRYVYAGFKKQF